MASRDMALRTCTIALRQHGLVVAARGLPETAVHPPCPGPPPIKERNEERNEA
jgi:hypothetical protein